MLILIFNKFSTNVCWVPHNGRSNRALLENIGQAYKSKFITYKINAIVYSAK